MNIMLKKYGAGEKIKRRSVYNKDKLSKLEKEDPMLYKIDEKLETSNEFDKTPQEYLTNPSKNST